MLTREQIDALSDDPDELRRQLMDIAGPDAKIIVDSFEGRELPPKALIKSIRITRDQFAPEVHYAGEFRIEILTQPGIGPVRGNMRMGFYDSAMDGKNPARRRARSGAEPDVRRRAERHADQPARLVQHQFQRPGQLLDAGAGRRDAERTGPANAPMRSPHDNASISGGVDYALTRDQVLRLNFNGSRFIRENTGIGNYDSIERAYSSEDSNFGLFLQQNGPLGRRFVLNTRLSVFGNDSTTRSAVEAPTIIVNDAFTIGGAQRRGGTHARNYWLNSDLDYVRGIHSMRTGVEVQYARSGRIPTATISAPTSSRISTAYEARPAAQLHAPHRRSATSVHQRAGRHLHPGRHQGPQGADAHRRRALRAQTHVPDKLNFAPRAGFTWAPFKSGKTTLRGSWGIFYDWLPTGIYAQTLQIDGFRQRELNVINPSYPDPGIVGTTPPTNRYLLAEDRPMAYSQRLSAGIAQTISRRINTNVLYSYAYRYSLLTGRNLNAPVNGVRPDPDFANIILASPDGGGTQHYVNASMNINLAPMGRRAGRRAAAAARS